MIFSNEAVTFIYLIIYMFAAVGVYRLGKIWLQAFVITSYFVAYVTTLNFYDFWGYTVSAGLITYAGIFLATDMISERYGKQAGFQTIKLSVSMILMFTAFTQLSLFFMPLEFAQEGYAAMQEMFGSTLRLIAAGISVYFFSQMFDVWIYNRIHNLTGEHYLWFRNCGSTMTSQLIDTVLFFTLAFYGSIPNNALVELIIVSYIFKLCVALADTPFMYLAKKMIPLDMKGKQNG